MLSTDERQLIDEEIRRYSDKQAAAVEALKVVQQRTGWISDNDLYDIAAYLDMDATELDSIATFYNRIFRRPVGRHVIMVCDSVSCWIMGYATICEHLKSRLEIDFGGTTPDRRFTLLPIPCLGACDKAPAMIIDNTLCDGLTTKKVDDILEGYK